jgi:hypothetical protein
VFERFLLCAVIATFATVAQAAVVVTFKDPDKFTDLRSNRYTREKILEEIEAHLQRLGKIHLRADETLKIEVLDIDLAGEERYGFSGGTQTRVNTGRADWPAIRLRYTLEAPGKPAESREETLSDMNYLDRPITGGAERFVYEKRMLDEWFRRRFAR